MLPTMAAVAGTSMLVFAAMAVMIVMAMVIVMVVMIMVIVAVMIAVDIRIILQAVRQKRLYRFIRSAGHTAVKFDPCLSESLLCPSPNATANQHIHLPFRQKTRQGAVAAARRVHHLFIGNLSILCVVDLDLTGMSKMLKYQSILIRYRNSHRKHSFCMGI